MDSFGCVFGVEVNVVAVQLAKHNTEAKTYAIFLLTIPYSIYKGNGSFLNFINKKTTPQISLRGLLKCR